ncbi:serine/threonine-protein kinase [Nannocystis pusilla]|uniref:Serine/threonine protein kinase n=1 Tax=Nannocystis pusilla TaxID=889268 RepID=A0ABS7U015_9BACT|nr:serine/threonine-protein kinase [Nannocystis pusilla]MBZ5713794.1 serine/threonine protein kinase [Nannocystis pusilla]
MDASLPEDLEDLCTTRRTLSTAERELFGTLSDSLGRYSLLGRLGSGSMGVVYRAYDPRLQRPVAVKVLYPTGKPTAHQVSTGDARLLREAQAIARLSHPNIVAVHDVGVAGDRVFLTMEFVEGPTLRQYCDAAPRGWREVLPLLIQAGRGLAAAHRGGVIHRDIKPDNILVGDDGRVRVVDFSVARPQGSSGETLLGKFHLTDTETNVLVGTPAYMAPEQLRASPACPRSDQFAFCVTAYECLFGERPFAGPTLRTLIDNVLAGPPTQPPPFSQQIPRALYQCIARGLALDADDRWPDMDTLLAHLEAILVRGQRRSSLVLAASLGAAAALTLGAAAAHYTGSSCSHPELAAHIGAR